jgi:hypothetical protein
MNQGVSLRALFAKQSPSENEEIASSQKPLLAMTKPNLSDGGA